VTPDELAARLGAGTAPVVLDVRSAEEYADGHIPGAVNVPFWRIVAGATPDAAPKHEPVVVYCGHGPRARLAMLGLRARGFRALDDLDGHWAAWTRLNLPVTRGGRP
jgi:rhodanese-related sulfurtransferase